MSDASVVTDAARLILSLLAGVALAQLASISWRDWRAGDRTCTSLQLALLVGLALAIMDSALLVGEPWRPHLFVPRSLIVALVLGYAVDRGRTR